MLSSRFSGKGGDFSESSDGEDGEGDNFERAILEANIPPTELRHLSPEPTPTPVSQNSYFYFYVTEREVSSLFTPSRVLLFRFCHFELFEKKSVRDDIFSFSPHRTLRVLRLCVSQRALRKDVSNSFCKKDSVVLQTSIVKVEDSPERERVAPKPQRLNIPRSDKERLEDTDIEAMYERYVCVCVCPSTTWAWVAGCVCMCACVFW